LGVEVRREYYVNDAGGQIERFADSIAARMRGEDPPEDGYAGDYVTELAESLKADGLGPDDRDQIAANGVEAMRASAERTLTRYGVEFDTWFSERSLSDDALLEGLVEELRRGGAVYESDGATWLRTTSFGDDKDRVLLRSGGEPTYFLIDIAYHRDKLERSGGSLLDVLGADHHGYTARLRAGLAALELDPELLEFSIMQLVHIVDGGERAQMSKRRGEFVTLDELLDDIGVDATRFFMLQRSHDTAVDLDLELARTQSSDNPVYYVQYAHARIASILRKAGDTAVEEALAAGPATVAMEPAERALTKRLLELPSVVQGAADRRAPHRLCSYATATAADFHAFYRDCQVVGAAGEGVEAERIRLCLLAKLTIAQTLELLGIDAPESM
jgi:arginyl-tRNA synthetase